VHWILQRLLSLALSVEVLACKARRFSERQEASKLLLCIAVCCVDAKLQRPTWP